MEDCISVVSSQYCSPNSLNLKIDTKKGVTYINDKVVFKVPKTFFTLHNRRVLYDVSGNPIITLHKTNITAHDRWQVFKGKSKDPTELLFKVKRSSVIQTGMIDLDIFLANNRNESVCDFKVNVSRKKHSCDIFAGESSRIVAKMKNNGAFEVLVHPNIDYAFIVALLLTVDRMKYFDDDLSELATVAVTESLAVLCMSIFCFN